MFKAFSNINYTHYTTTHKMFCEIMFNMTKAIIPFLVSLQFNETILPEISQPMYLLLRAESHSSGDPRNVSVYHP